MKASEISRRGYQALIKELGYAGAARFLLRFESGSGDYTKDRHQGLEQLTMDDFRDFVHKKREKMIENLH
ncbi:hypothetical protein HCU40_02975 [Pseudanabaena biceps]|nr:hypothetical protein [Pseudanabaena biceps]